MEIKIKKDKETKEITISFGNAKPIIASEKSDSWNTKSINNLLIKIAENNPDEEKLTIKILSKNIDEEEDNDLIFIAKLFESFAEEFNKN